MDPSTKFKKKQITSSFSFSCFILQLELSQTNRIVFFLDNSLSIRHVFIYPEELSFLILFMLNQAVNTHPLKVQVRKNKEKQQLYIR